MEAIILTGLQASGKSTFYKLQFADTHVRINLDMLGTRDKEDKLLQACIDGKIPFVIDNTNATPEEREKYVSLAKAAKFNVISFYVNAGRKDCEERNRERKGKSKVPDVAIRATNKQMVLPSQEEGFDKMYAVNLREHQGEIVVWQIDER